MYGIVKSLAIQSYPVYMYICTSTAPPLLLQYAELNSSSKCR